MTVAGLWTLIWLRTYVMKTIDFISAPWTFKRLRSSVQPTVRNIRVLFAISMIALVHLFNFCGLELEFKLVRFFGANSSLPCTHQFRVVVVKAEVVVHPCSNHDYEEHYRSPWKRCFVDHRGIQCRRQA